MNSRDDEKTFESLVKILIKSACAVASVCTWRFWQHASFVIWNEWHEEVSNSNSSDSSRKVLSTQPKPNGFGIASESAEERNLSFRFSDLSACALIDAPTLCIKMWSVKFLYLSIFVFLIFANSGSSGSGITSVTQKDVCLIVCICRKIWSEAYVFYTLNVYNRAVWGLWKMTDLEFKLNETNAQQ